MYKLNVNLTDEYFKMLVEIMRKGHRNISDTIRYLIKEEYKRLTNS